MFFPIPHPNEVTKVEKIELMARNFFAMTLKLWPANRETDILISYHGLIRVAAISAQRTAIASL